MVLITDTVAIGARCSNEEIERLGTGVTGAFGQHVHQVTIGLCVELVQHKTGNIQAMLGSDLYGEDLIETRIVVVHKTLASSHDLASP